MREGRARAPWVQHVYLNQVIADIFDAQEPYASRCGVELVADVDGVAMLDWGVPPDLVYAFENLIQNAVKYSNDGGRVVARLRVLGGVATVTVTDEGIGIPEEILSDIFLEFVRAPNAKEHVREGTGLGLSVCRGIIEAHGGQIWVESEKAKGSTFKFSLPVNHKEERHE